MKFKKTSGSAPVFLYFTVHYDGVNGDFLVYPTNWPNEVYMVAYEVDGLTDIVDSDFYDTHQTYEIRKTEMKMLIPLNTNTQKVLNCPSIKPQILVVLGVYEKTNKYLQNVYLGKLVKFSFFIRDTLAEYPAVYSRIGDYSGTSTQIQMFQTNFWFFRLEICVKWASYSK